MYLCIEVSEMLRHYNKYIFIIIHFMHPVSSLEAVMLFLKDFLFASDFLHRIATWQTFKAFGSGKITGSG